MSHTPIKAALASAIALAAAASFAADTQSYTPHQGVDTKGKQVAPDETLNTTATHARDLADKTAGTTGAGSSAIPSTSPGNMGRSDEDPAGHTDAAAGTGTDTSGSSRGPGSSGSSAAGNMSTGDSMSATTNTGSSSIPSTSPGNLGKSDEDAAGHTDAAASTGTDTSGSNRGPGSNETGTSRY